MCVRVSLCVHICVFIEFQMYCALRRILISSLSQYFSSHKHTYICMVWVTLAYVLTELHHYLSIYAFKYNISSVFSSSVYTHTLITTYKRTLVYTGNITYIRTCNPPHNHTSTLQWMRLCAFTYLRKHDLMIRYIVYLLLNYLLSKYNTVLIKSLSNDEVSAALREISHTGY